ncbi:hypothetical protein Acr_13g0011060 [Actinidia rufa]|uniref:Uncharacterized protein n=1 Tax=Actinidia rufa TaxID=165716 RepID=A0A7J0FMV5_9ERIC|nr:hypothetical protein Acr_13g0011060 [Actinidia rufa]
MAVITLARHTVSNVHSLLHGVMAMIAVMDCSEEESSSRGSRRCRDDITMTTGNIGLSSPWWLVMVCAVEGGRRWPMGLGEVYSGILVFGVSWVFWDFDFARNRWFLEFGTLVFGF